MQIEAVQKQLLELDEKQKEYSSQQKQNEILEFADKINLMHSNIQSNGNIHINQNFTILSERQQKPKEATLSKEVFLLKQDHVILTEKYDQLYLDFNI